MKALRYFGERNIRYDDMSEPTILDGCDAIVQMAACSICGSDLHIYHGHGFSDHKGFCVGHEAVGEIVEVGRDVRRLKVGDKVMMPANIGCGQCRSCLRGNVINCETNASVVYGLSNNLQGVQAEAFRVPIVDMNAWKIPDGLDSDRALMLTDALPTAWFGARSADIKPGSSVAVIGLGPIGLMAVDCALIMGASLVFAIDPVPERRSFAHGSGAIALSPDEALETIRETTSGRKVECVIEAVGSDASVDLALRLVGRRGTVAAIGAHQTRRYAFPLERAFASGLTFRTGVCSILEEWPALVPLVQSGRLRPERYISHHLPLDQGEDAYRLFDRREEGALKVVLTS